MRYKLKIQLKNAISFIDPIYFDALLTSLWLKDVYGFVPTPLQLRQEDVIQMPPGLLTEHPDGFYLASMLMFPVAEDTEYTTHFTKHFEARYVNRAKFSGKRKIMVNKGDYKSYQLPILLHTFQYP